MKRESIYIILGAFAVFTAFEDCNKGREATSALRVVDTVLTVVDTITTVVDTVPGKDLTKIFVGTYNGYSIRSFKHPSFFSDSIQVASIVISQIDSTTMRIRFYLDTTFLFENIDTAFAGNIIFWELTQLKKSRMKAN